MSSHEVVFSFSRMKIERGKRITMSGKEEPTGGFVKSSTIQFPIISDIARRNLALKEARFKLLSKRLCRYSDLIAVESLLTENEGWCFGAEFLAVS